MITPEEFYTEKDSATPQTRKRMWGRIERALPQQKIFLISDKRSFVYGMAASFVLFLAGVGAFDLIRQGFESSQSVDTRLDKAYRSAIKELEAVVPSAISVSTENPNRQGSIQSRKQQLQLINEAIAGLRTDIEHGGPSPIKSSRLRELYSLKLQALQNIIENGEVEL